MSQTHPTPRLNTISIGGATYDLFLTMGAAIKEEGEHLLLKIGGKLPVESVIECSGGGACNTSIGFSRLGCTAAFCGIVGSDQWGEKLLHNLQSENVDVSPATVVEGETSSFSIVLTLSTGERTILYAPGVNEHLHDTTFDLEAVERADAVYLNHLSETACVIENDIVAALLKKPNLQLAWNPGGCQIEAGMHARDKADLLKATTLLILNKEESLAFTGLKTVEEAMQALLSAGAKNICITDGKNGTVATDGVRQYHCPILQVTVKETTGAGDAFGTAASWALFTGHSLPEAMAAGTLNAASVVSQVGAQAGLLTDTQIAEKLASHLLPVETFEYPHTSHPPYVR